MTDRFGWMSFGCARSMLDDIESTLQLGQSTRDENVAAKIATKISTWRRLMDEKDVVEVNALEQHEEMMERARAHDELQAAYQAPWRLRPRSAEQQRLSDAISEALRCLRADVEKNREVEEGSR